MATTEQMPKSVHSGISTEAVGEHLLQHYNMGIKNPWYDEGYSDQETYNRRKLPWAGKSYTVTEDGELMGPNTEELKDGLTDNWVNLAEASRDIMQGEGAYGDLESLYEGPLADIGSRLSNQ